MIFPHPESCTFRSAPGPPLFAKGPLSLEALGWWQCQDSATCPDWRSPRNYHQRRCPFHLGYSWMMLDDVWATNRDTGYNWEWSAMIFAWLASLSPSSLQDSPSHLVLECQILECHLVLEFGTGGFCRYVSLNMSCSVCQKLNWQFSEHLDKCGTFSRLHCSQSVSEHFAHTHILQGLYGAPAWKRFARGRTPTRNLPITGQ